jgi:hypothetical protein
MMRWTTRRVSQFGQWDRSVAEGNGPGSVSDGGMDEGLRRLVPGTQIVLQRILRDGHGACHRARIRATRWWPPPAITAKPLRRDEVQFVATQQPHAEERATRASRSMGSKRPTEAGSFWGAPDIGQDVPVTPCAVASYQPVAFALDSVELSDFIYAIAKTYIKLGMNDGTAT